MNNIMVNDSKHIIDISTQRLLGSSYIQSEYMRSDIRVLIDNIKSKENILNCIILPTKASTLFMPPLKTTENNTILCTAIGLAGWTAWTYADAIRDDDYPHSKSDLLSIYTVLVSMVHDCIRQLNLSQDNYTIVSSLFGIMERANYEEYFDYKYNSNQLRNNFGFDGRMCSKSIPVSIPMLAIFMNSGASKKDIDLCLSFFGNFLDARQLSDDALDWQEDMLANRHTLVTYWIDNQARKDSCISSNKDIFENIVSDHASQQIQKSLDLAQTDANNISCIKNTDFLTDILEPYRTK